ncbi:MAG TPA: hypothetical protein VND64_30055, partial [Pirellulales bacterium]|nr:hypothetical protein [Pirellulales bacterium]
MGRPAPTAADDVNTAGVVRASRVSAGAWIGRPSRVVEIGPFKPLLPPARRRVMLTGVAKPLAKLVALLTPKRRWAQFSLATLLAVVAVLCVALSQVVVPAQRQRRAVVAIEAVKGFVDYFGFGEPDPKASEAFPKAFLRRWLPRDYIDNVRQVHLYNSQVTD